MFRMIAIAAMGLALMGCSGNGESTSGIEKTIGLPAATSEPGPEPEELQPDPVLRPK